MKEKKTHLHKAQKKSDIKMCFSSTSLAALMMGMFYIRDKCLYAKVFQ